MKIAAKFTVVLLLCLVAALTFRAYGEVRTQVGAFRGDLGAQHTLIGRALRPAVVEVWRADGQDHALRVVAEADRRMRRVDIRWVSLDAQAGAADRPVAGAAPLAPLARGEDVVWIDGAADRRGRIYSYVPLGVPTQGASALEVSESLDGEVEVERAAIRGAMSVAISTLLVSGLTMSILGFLIVGRPMRRLIEQARRIGAGDLSQRIAVRQRDEIGALAQEMNRMADRLAESQQAISRATQAKLRAIEQLRHADRLATVGRLAAGLAHELGTPLNVVQARARSIADGKVTHDVARSHASIVVEQVDKMVHLMRQLLDFARKRELKREEVDLTAVVRRVVGLTAPMATKRQVDVLVEPSDSAVRLSADPGQLEQVVTNLLTNAIHASTKGQVVTVRVEPRPDGGGAITVEDRGVGIPEQNLARIFEPFFTTKQVGEGTGLGLSVAYGIVQDHGGSITVESKPPVGSKFVVALPARADETRRHTAPEMPPDAASSAAV